MSVAIRSTGALYCTICVQNETKTSRQARSRPVPSLSSRALDSPRITPLARVEASGRPGLRGPGNMTHVVERAVLQLLYVLSRLSSVTRVSSGALERNSEEPRVSVSDMCASVCVCAWRTARETPAESARESGIAANTCRRAHTAAPRGERDARREAAVRTLRGHVQPVDHCRHERGHVATSSRAYRPRPCARISSKVTPSSNRK